MPELFVDGRRRKGKESEADSDALYQEIGRLKVELDWLKKKLECSSEQARALVDRDHAELSLRRQCELLGISRSGLYYTPVGESQENLRLMRMMDEQYTRTPIYESRRMTAWLASQGLSVNRKPVSRLMGQMGIEAVYPKPKLSQPGGGPKIDYLKEYAPVSEAQDGIDKYFRFYNQEPLHQRLECRTPAGLYLEPR